MRRKAPVLLTVAIVIIGILGGAALLFLPDTDAPRIHLALYDADGKKSVSVGETAEYVIKLENEGETTGHIDLRSDGEAHGWTSRISHETVHLGAGSWQTISLFVTPTSEDAEPWIDVNVIATRANNVTVVGTTTYLRGTVQIRQVGIGDWSIYTPASNIEEGDILRTDRNSYVQLEFDESLNMILMPESEIYIRYSNSENNHVIYEFILEDGEAAFSVNLPDALSSFTLETASGAKVMVNSPDQTIFRAQSNGYVEVLKNQVSYDELLPSERGNGGTRAEQQIQSGKDSDGKIFNYASLSYPNKRVMPILNNALGASMGFENSGNFVANGDFNGFVFRMDDRDNFYLLEGDSSFIDMDIMTIGSGLFDISFTQYAPDPLQFHFQNIETVSKNIEILFQSDRMFITSSSDMTYDLEIRVGDDKVFKVTEIELIKDQGNSFIIEDISDIGDPDSKAVIFGRDKDGDGRVDESAAIKSGMDGEDINDSIGEKDKDEDNDLLWYGIIFLFIILLIIFYIVFIRPEMIRKPRTKADREEAFRLLREDLKQARLLATREMEEMTEEEGESWDEVPTPPVPGIPTSPEDLLPPGFPPMPETPVEAPIEDEIPPEITEPEEWKPEEPGVPEEVPLFKEEIKKPEYEDVGEYLKAEPDVGDFIDPQELRENVKKQIKEMEDWWQEWNEEMDDLLKE